MSQYACSHCGKPVSAGNLCSDCQALRAYHPDVFFAQNGNSGIGIDRSVIFAVSSVVALAILVGIAWPYVRGGTKKTAVATPVHESSTHGDLGERRDTRVADNRVPTTPTISYLSRQLTPPPAPIVSGSDFPSRPLSGPQRVYTQPVYRTALVGNNLPAAQSSLSAFISAYCSERQSETGRYVRSTGVTMFPNGVGAMISFDDGGQYRQGTAQYAAGSGWSWLQYP